MWFSDGFVISCGNRIIHAPTLGVHKRVDLDNWLSVSSLTSTAKSKICSVAFASGVVSGLGVVTISGRQLSGFPSHVCPLIPPQQVFSVYWSAWTCQICRIVLCWYVPLSDTIFLSDLVGTITDKLLVFTSAPDAM